MSRRISRRTTCGRRFAPMPRHCLSTPRASSSDPAAAAGDGLGRLPSRPAPAGDVAPVPTRFVGRVLQCPYSNGLEGRMTPLAAWILVGILALPALVQARDQSDLFAV